MTGASRIAWAIVSAILTHAAAAPLALAQAMTRAAASADLKARR